MPSSLHCAATDTITANDTGNDRSIRSDGGRPALPWTTSSSDQSKNFEKAMSHARISLAKAGAHSSNSIAMSVHRDP